MAPSSVEALDVLGVASVYRMSSSVSQLVVSTFALHTVYWFGFLVPLHFTRYTGFFLVSLHFTRYTGLFVCLFSSLVPVHFTQYTSFFFSCVLHTGNWTKLLLDTASVGSLGLIKFEEYVFCLYIVIQIIYSYSKHPSLYNYYSPYFNHHNFLSFDQDFLASILFSITTLTFL